MARPPKPADELLPKERRFVVEYLLDRNGTQAAIRAGYARRSADVTAARLLGKARVSAALKEAVSEQLERLKLEADRVLRHALAIATLDPARAKDAQGAWLPLEKMPEDVRHAVSGYEVEIRETDDGARPGCLTKVKFHPKLPAIETIAKHAGLLGTRVDLHLPQLEQLLAESEGAE